jgi:hypothetical protein
MKQAPLLIAAVLMTVGLSLTGCSGRPGAGDSGNAADDQAYSRLTPAACAPTRSRTFPTSSHNRSRRETRDGLVRPRRNRPELNPVPGGRTGLQVTPAGRRERQRSADPLTAPWLVHRGRVHRHSRAPRPPRPEPSRRSHADPPDRQFPAVQRRRGSVLIQDARLTSQPAYQGKRERTAASPSSLPSFPGTTANRHAERPTCPTRRVTT